MKMQKFFNRKQLYDFNGSMNLLEIPKAYDLPKLIKEDYYAIQKFLISDHDSSQDFREVVDNTEFDPEIIQEILRLSLDEIKHVYTFFVLALTKYIWGYGSKNIRDRVPRCISIPLIECSNILNIPPFVSHKMLILWNWKALDEKKLISFDNITLLYHFFSCKDRENRENFAKFQIMIEILRSKMLSFMLECRSYLIKNDEYGIKNSIFKISEAINEIITTHGRLDEFCSSDYYNNAQSNFEDLSDKKLFPEGLIFEGTNIRMTSIFHSKLPSVNHALNVFFGLQFVEKDIYTINNENLNIFFGPQEKILMEIEREPTLRTYVKNTKNKEIYDLYNQSIEQLIQLKKSFLKIGIDQFCSENARDISFNSPEDSLMTSGTDRRSDFISAIRDLHTKNIAYPFIHEQQEADHDTVSITLVKYMLIVTIAILFVLVLYNFYLL